MGIFSFSFVLICCCAEFLNVEEVLANTNCLCCGRFELIISISQQLWWVRSLDLRIGRSKWIRVDVLMRFNLLRIHSKTFQLYSISLFINQMSISATRQCLDSFQCFSKSTLCLGPRNHLSPMLMPPKNLDYALRERLPPKYKPL